MEYIFSQVPDQAPPELVGHSEQCIQHPLLLYSVFVLPVNQPRRTGQLQLVNKPLKTQTTKAKQ